MGYECIDKHIYAATISGKKIYIYISFMIPCTIIITKCYDGTPLPHTNKHGTQFKIYNTHFLHSYHPHYTQVHSRL